MAPALTLRNVARGSGIVAALAGALGVLHVFGAFGPVSCWTGRSASSDGTVTVTRGCEAGIDYLLGTGGGNAGTLFAWGIVLAVVVSVGVAAVYRGQRGVVWAAGLASAVISVIGIFSIGWYFVIPALALLVSATALTLAARGERSGAAAA